MQAHWKRGQSIGRGSAATVSTAVCCVSGQVFAVKSAELSQSESLQREQRILSSLSCPHVVSYKNFDITRENMFMYNLHLEYIHGGSLWNEIQKNKGKLDEAKIGYYTRQILEGLHFLHSNGVVHCDIKSKNILVDDEQVVKIADFGCAKRVDHAEAEVDQMGGTPMFMAPEVARGEEQSYPCDIWALGCIIIEMGTAHLPWQDVSDVVSVLYKIAFSSELPEIPSYSSEHAKDFLDKCLRRNPRERWTAAQLLEHPFVAGLDHELKLAQECRTSSPTSIIDQGFWSSVEDSESLENLVPKWSFDCPLERLTLFSNNSGEPRWENDGNWITIRCNDEDVMCC